MCQAAATFEMVHQTRRAPALLGAPSRRPLSSDLFKDEELATPRLDLVARGDELLAPSVCLVELALKSLDHKTGLVAVVDAVGVPCELPQLAGNLAVPRRDGSDLRGDLSGV